MTQILLEHTPDFFTKVGNFLRYVYKSPYIAWALALGFSVSLLLSRMELGDYKSALRNCGMKLEVIEKAYSVTE